MKLTADHLYGILHSGSTKGIVNDLCLKSGGEEAGGKVLKNSKGWDEVFPENTALLAPSNKGILPLLPCCLGVGIRSVEEGSLSGGSQGAAETPKRGEEVHPPLL